MTFGRDVLSYSIDFLSPLILQKTKEDIISQLGDYGAPFFEQQLVISGRLYRLTLF